MALGSEVATVAGLAVGVLVAIGTIAGLIGYLYAGVPK